MIEVRDKRILVLDNIVFGDEGHVRSTILKARKYDELKAEYDKLKAEIKEGDA